MILVEFLLRLSINAAQPQLFKLLRQCGQVVDAAHLGMRVINIEERLWHFMPYCTLKGEDLRGVSSIYFHVVAYNTC